MFAIDPDGPGGEPAFLTYCDMVRYGGGWTMVALYGRGFARPTQWSGATYPRPGAAFFNSDTNGPTLDAAVLRATVNDGDFASFSVNALTLWANSSREILAYVEGSTDDYITAQLPAGCNYFDASSYYEENTYGQFEVNLSDCTL